MEFTSNEAKLDLCSIPLLYFSLQTLKRIEKGSPNESNKNELNSHFEVFSNKKNEVKYPHNNNERIYPETSI